jgi:hypothetical protein
VLFEPNTDSVSALCRPKGPDNLALACEETLGLFQPKDETGLLQVRNLLRELPRRERKIAAHQRTQPSLNGLLGSLCVLIDKGTAKQPPVSHVVGAILVEL